MVTMTTILERGTCHGFQVVSSLPHPTLAPGPGRELKVEEIALRRQPAGSHLLSFPERRGRLPVTVTTPGPHLYEVGTTSLGVFEVDTKRPFIGVPPATDSLRREMLTLGTPLALLIQQTGDLAMHSAAIAPGDKAVLISGPGGAGKSTLTAAALARRWRVLTDDLCRLQPEPLPVVFQGPAVARVREPALAFLDSSSFHELGRGAGKIHLGPIRFDSYSPAKVAVGAIVMLTTGSGGLSLSPVRAEEAIPHLWKQAFFLPAETSRASCFKMVATLADAVPVWRLRYEHTPDSLQPTLDLLSDLLKNDA